MNDANRRRIAAQLNTVGCPDEAISLVLLEVSNAEWRGYALGYKHGEDGEERLDANVELGW